MLALFRLNWPESGGSFQDFIVFIRYGGDRMRKKFGTWISQVIDLAQSRFLISVEDFNDVGLVPRVTWCVHWAL